MYERTGQKKVLLSELRTHLSADLVAALAGLQMNDFTHLEERTEVSTKKALFTN